MADFIDEIIGDWDPRANISSGGFFRKLLLILCAIVILPIILILALALLALVLCVIALLAGLVIWYVLPAFGVDTSAAQAWLDALSNSLEI